ALQHRPDLPPVAGTALRPRPRALLRAVAAAEGDRADRGHAVARWRTRPAPALARGGCGAAAGRLRRGDVRAPRRQPAGRHPRGAGATRRRPAVAGAGPQPVAAPAGRARGRPRPGAAYPRRAALPQRGAAAGPVLLRPAAAAAARPAARGAAGAPGARRRRAQPLRRGAAVPAALPARASGLLLPVRLPAE